MPNLIHRPRAKLCGILLAAASALPLSANAQPADFNPLDPFAVSKTASEYAALFEISVAVEPDDPFHNLTTRELGFELTWDGQWRTAAANGKSFEEFWDSLQGNAGGGRSTDMHSPYPYATAEAHWNAWLAAAHGGTKHTRASLPDWSGDWSGGGGTRPGTLVRQNWEAVSAAYRPRYLLLLQAEAEGRHWWPGDGCYPNGFANTGWSIRYFMLDPGMVVLAYTDPLNQSRFIFTDGRGFLPPESALPQWMGESQGFWDGDQLVVWTRNIIANSGGHGNPEYSDQLELIERYAKLGDQIVVDVTWYDPVAYAFPWHGVGTFARRSLEQGWLRQPPTLNECVTTNNVYHDENGVIAELSPDDSRYHDIFDSTPWLTVFKRSEAAKEAGLLPAAQSIESLEPALQ